MSDNLLYRSLVKELKMTEKHKITIEIPDNIYAGIMAFSKNNKISDSGEAIMELVKHALKLPPYFKNFDWEMAEKEADEEINSGDVMEFSDVDDFLNELNS